MVQQAIYVPSGGMGREEDSCFATKFFYPPPLIC